MRFKKGSSSDFENLEAKLITAIKRYEDAEAEVNRWRNNSDCNAQETKDLKAEVERLLGGLERIRHGGNEGNDAAIRFQKIAAHTMDPKRWLDPE